MNTKSTFLFIWKSTTDGYFLYSDGYPRDVILEAPRIG